MFEVVKQVINNPFKPEIVDSTTIILKQRSPFVQMAYRYDEDLSGLSDKEAIDKVLSDFHKEHYKNKIQEGKIIELELDFARQKENFEIKLSEISGQNTMIQKALFELAEEMLKNEEPVESEEVPEESVDEPIEEEGGTDVSNEQIDGDSDS